MKMIGRCILLSRSSLSSVKNHSISANTIFGHQNLSSLRNFSATQVRNMKLLQFSYKEQPEEIRVGFLDGDKVVDLNKADPTIPTTLVEVLKGGDLDKVKKCLCSTDSTVPLSSVTLRAPITGVDKVLCIGLNYQDHCEEQKLQPPPVPMIFSKFASTIVGPNEPVRLRTEVTKKVDWEIELAVVIGKTASDVKAADAYNYILGYTIAQDISARDWQKEKNMGQFLLGKSMDTFCPLGPWIVTHDEVGDPQQLDIGCSLNGVEKQKSNTRQLVHKIPDVIERLSSVMTLLPGDVLLTGTPGGVGMYRQPPEYLQPGDLIRNHIEKIGVLEVRVEKF